MCLAAQLCTAGAASAQNGADKNEVQSIHVAGQKDPSAWIVVESQHFKVTSNAGNDAVATLLNNLERLDFVLRSYTKPYRKAAAGAQKLSFTYFDSADDLTKTFPDLPTEGVGLYSTCAAGVQGFGVHLEPIVEQTGKAFVKGPVDDTLAYLFEAYARHFLYRYTTIRTPTSFIDGFAQYFATVRFSDTQMVVGRTPTTMGRYLHFLDEGNNYSLDYTDVLEGRDGADEGRPGAKYAAVNYGGQAGIKLEFDARSWLLTHYMLSTEPNRQHTLTYLNLTGHGTAPAQAFEQAFGIKIGDLGNAMWRYRLPGGQVMQVDEPDLPRAEMSFTSLPRSTGQVVVADAVLHSCPSPKRGAEVLRTVATTAARYPDNTRVQMTLSRAQVGYGNPQDALPFLLKATAKDHDNAEAHALLGMAYLRLAEAANGADGGQRTAYLASAHASLLRADALTPRTPDVTLALLQTDVLAQGKPDTQRLAAVIEAWQGAREIDALTRAAFFAYAFQGDGESAAVVLRVLSNNSRDPANAAWAAEWKRRLDAGLTVPDLVGGVRDSTRDVARGGIGRFDEWTIANTQIMQNIEYNAGLAKAQHIIDGLVQNPDPSQQLMSAPVRR